MIASRTIFWNCLLLLVLTARTALADDATQLFETANRLYEERKYPESAATYQAVLDSGKASSAVYFNQGNAWFKAGQIGRAIVSYQQAGKLSPRDPDIRANLQFARNQVQGVSLHPARWQRALARLSLGEWTVLAMVPLWLTFGLLAVMQWRPGLKPALRTATVALGCVAFVFAITLLTATQAGSTRDLVVVTARDVIIRNGPLDESQTAYTANDGAELRVVDRKDEWLQVTDGTRRSGWLKRREVSPL